MTTATRRRPARPRTRSGQIKVAYDLAHLQREVGWRTVRAAATWILDCERLGLDPHNTSARDLHAAHGSALSSAYRNREAFRLLSER